MVFEQHPASGRSRTPDESKTERVFDTCGGADVGRTAVYAAEEMAFGGTDAEDIRPIADLAAVARTVTTGEWWRAAGGPPVRVVLARPGTGSSSARSSRGGASVDVRLAAPQATIATLAHELAHALAGVAHGHDGVFRRAHVDVGAVLVGGAAATHLTSSYEALRVPPAARRWRSPVRVVGDGFEVLP